MSEALIPEEAREMVGQLLSEPLTGTITAKEAQRFALAFDAPMSGTVDDRKAAGNIDAREERYFAIARLAQREHDVSRRHLNRLGHIKV